MENPTNQRILSGIQPSGILHVGNYLGALKQWVQLQEANETFFCIVDEHAITVPYEPAELQERILATAALYIACGLDPDKSVIFVQSHVPEHTELSWLLATTAPYGDLTRMTQFKDKSKKLGKDSVSAGLFMYPLLMAADILLYHPTMIPVGEDQTQHIELTRDIVKRFNNRFGDYFKTPRAYTNPHTARIMSLTDPKKKMSKSDEPKTYIALTDPPDVIRKKIGSATTDTKPIFSFTKSGPAVKNLLNIYKALTNEESVVIEERFAGKGYKEFKDELAERIIATLQPIQDHYHTLRQSDDELRIMLGRGKHRAGHVAAATLRDVKEKMGLL